jgi:heat shock protein HslJ
MKYVVAPLLAVIVLAGLLLAGCQNLKSPLEDRTWVLTSYHGLTGGTHEALAGTEVTATFDSQTDTVSGSGGCNSYGADYTLDKLTLTIEHLFRTEMACLDDAVNEQEHAFFQALEKAREFRLGRDSLTITGGGWQLDFIEKTTP